MAEYSNGNHTVYDIRYHFVWITKYRYKVLKRKIAVRLRDLLEQGCKAKGIRVMKGSTASDRVHMLLSCPTDLAPIQIMQYLKGHSSHLIQDACPELKKGIGDRI